MKDWTQYSRVAFEALKANQQLWATGDQDAQRAVTKIYYDLVFSSGYNRTGLISEAAVTAKLNGKKVTEDHFLSPQFLARLIMDTPDPFLTNYKAFEKLFAQARQVIVVTPAENKALSQLTTNLNGQFIVHIPTVHKYQHLNMNLMSRQGRGWSNLTPVTGEFTTLVDFPQALTTYEEQFIPRIK